MTPLKTRMIATLAMAHAARRRFHPDYLILRSPHEGYVLIAPTERARYEAVGFVVVAA